MRTYNYPDYYVNVINCDWFQLARLYNNDGYLIHEIRTFTRGKKAAEMVIHDAQRFRLI